MRPSWWSRFVAKVRHEDRGHETLCWIWTANRYTDGYGQFKLDGRPQRAHRVAYEAMVGLIPEGHALDHLCRVPLCVNPLHLEPVTQPENLRRRDAALTACVNGHPYDEDNTGIRPDGRRRCRACHREAQRRYLAGRTG